jgi:hypothetical protein
MDNDGAPGTMDDNSPGSGNAGTSGSAVSGSDRIVGVWTGEATQHAPSGAQDRATVRLEIPERTDKVVGSLEEIINSDHCAGNVELTNRQSGSFEFLYREERDRDDCISTTRLTLTVRSDAQLAFDERYETSNGSGTITGLLNLTEETPAPCAGDTDPLC